MVKILLNQFVKAYFFIKKLLFIKNLNAFFQCLSDAFLTGTDQDALQTNPVCRVCRNHVSDDHVVAEFF